MADTHEPGQLTRALIAARAARLAPPGARAGANSDDPLAAWPRPRPPPNSPPAARRSEDWAADAPRSPWRAAPPARAEAADAYAYGLDGGARAGSPPARRSPWSSASPPPPPDLPPPLGPPFWTEVWQTASEAAARRTPPRRSPHASAARRQLHSITRGHVARCDDGDGVAAAASTGGGTGARRDPRCDGAARNADGGGADAPSVHALRLRLVLARAGAAAVGVRTAPAVASPPRAAERRATAAPRRSPPPPIAAAAARAAQRAFVRGSEAAYGAYAWLDADGSPSPPRPCTPSRGAPTRAPVDDALLDSPARGRVVVACAPTAGREGSAGRGGRVRVGEGAHALHEDEVGRLRARAVVRRLAALGYPAEGQLTAMSVRRRMSAGVV
jgi:hypothetical protein